MSQMPRQFLLTTAVMACLCAQGVFAQTLPSRPGLWAEATEVKINGNAMPSGLDDLDASMRSSIAQAMRKLGLPAGWSPRMSCRTPADLNLQNWLAKAAKDCGNLSSKLSGNKLSVSGTCSQGGSVAQLKGSAQFNGDKEMVYQARVETTFRGKQVVSETHSISKWVGADCSNPPPGIDPAWLDEMGDANG